MKQIYSCFHCGAKFGDPVWRDNHASVCARVKATPEAKVRASAPWVPAPPPEQKFFGNFRLMPRATAEALDFVFDPEKQSATKA